MSKASGPLMSNWPAVRDLTATSHTHPYEYISETKVNLANRSVLITGGTKGIGLATAQSYAKAGCSKIAITSRTLSDAAVCAIKESAKSCNRPEPQVLFIASDVTSQSAVEKLAETIKREFGSLDILINNAGTVEAVVPFADSDPEEWWRTWEFNVKGIYLVTRALMPLLLGSELKTVINTSSCGAHMLMMLGYQASKTAVVRMTEIMTAQYGDKGLVAIAIHPGNVNTRLAHDAPDQFKDWFTETAELAGATTVWLTSERREWLNGRFVTVTWDMEELEAKKEDIVQRDTLKFRLTV